MIKNVSGSMPSQQMANVTSRQGKQEMPLGGFSAALEQEREKTQKMELPESGDSLAFSKHAMARAEQRGIEVTPDLMHQLASSVEKAEAKGASNILAFDTSRAFIINVPNQRVITTMTQEEMKENIFTNIDGAVLL